MALPEGTNAQGSRVSSTIEGDGDQVPRPNPEATGTTACMIVASARVIARGPGSATAIITAHSLRIASHCGEENRGPDLGDSAECTEEGADVVDQQIGCFESGEVAASGVLAPVRDVVVTGQQMSHGGISREDGDAGGYGRGASVV
jgi:hypothetical protein